MNNLQLRTEVREGFVVVYVVGQLTPQNCVPSAEEKLAGDTTSLESYLLDVVRNTRGYVVVDLSGIEAFLYETREGLQIAYITSTGLKALLSSLMMAREQKIPPSDVKLTRVSDKVWDFFKDVRFDRLFERVNLDE